MSILVSGSLVYDHIMNFPDSFRNHILPDQIHILNVCFMVDKLERSWGGTAGNIAYSMRLLGADPMLLSAVGRDGGDYVDYLAGQGINTKYVVHTKDQLTASAHITTDADDNQITAFYNGPLGLAGQVDLRQIKEKINLAIISPTQKDVMIKHLKECAELGIRTMFDPGQQMTAFSGVELKKMIEQAELVIGNDYEIKLLQERTGWATAEILENTKILITTLGERGSVIATSEGETIEIGVCSPRSFDDPTGAGDAYRAGFLSGYERGLSLKICGQMGAVAAAYAIETYGTQEHRFALAEFKQRYEKAFNQELIF